MSATVFLPAAAAGGGGGGAAKVVVAVDTPGGAHATAVVWDGARYAAGVAGVESARVATDGSGSVAVGIASGTYTFTTTTAATSRE